MNITIIQNSLKILIKEKHIQKTNPHLTVAAKQRSQGGVYIKNPNRPQLQPIANISPVHSNLPPQNQPRIHHILSDRSDLQLRLHLPRQPQVDVIHDVVAHQMPPLGELPAWHPRRQRRRSSHTRRLRGGGQGGRRRRRRNKIGGLD